MKPTEDYQRQDYQRHILVVDDEALIAADLQQRIERLGYPPPAIEHCGEAALRRARCEAFDLVLIDIRLNGPLDGISIAELLRSELQVPVVYLTAHSDQETLDRAILTEPLGYAVKPISDEELRSVLQTSLHKAAMDRRLRTSEAWLTTTLRSVGEGILAIDGDGEVVFLNPSAEQFTGWAAAQAQGRALMDVMALFDEVTGQPARNPVFDLAEEESRIYTLVSRNGARSLVEVECFENRSADQVLGSVVTLRDMRSRRESDRRMLQSQRMEAVANLAGGLAHDFNNQLTVILAYAGELAARLTGEDRDEVLEIESAASLAAATTTQLLALSRHGGERFEVLNVNQVIREAEPMIASHLGAAGRLTLVFGTPWGYIRGDRGQLEQLLFNLAINARSAMPQGGELRLESSTVAIGADQPGDGRRRAGSYVRLRIADTGQGLDPMVLAQIFEPRFSLASERFGCGLGLSMVHSTVIQSGGYISAESAPGQGTAFEILLPCVGTFHGAAEEDRDFVAGNAPTILLVEDEDGVRRLMHRCLEQQGYQLLSASSAEAAQEIAGVYRQSIDVLVTDVVMPGMAGPQLAERLQLLRPELKVLYVSGYRHDALDQQGLLGRGAHILAKPFPPAQLVRQVQALLHPGE